METEIAFLGIEIASVGIGTVVFLETGTFVFLETGNAVLEILTVFEGISFWEIAFVVILIFETGRVEILFGLVISSSHGD